MKERPILFNGEMVRAVLDGRKTQTRRVVKPDEDGYPHRPGDVFGERKLLLTSCPYGEPGDRLWVRESMKFDPDRGWRYCADGADVIESADYSKRTPSCPSIHMPRKASRIFLEVTDVRVERVQEITEKDAVSEGIKPVQFGLTTSGYEWSPTEDATDTAKESFYCLWNSINAKRGYGWDVNPWVWVVEFRRVSQ